MHRAFELQVGTEGETTELKVVGELDVGAVDSFRTRVCEALGTGCHHFVVDLRRARQIDGPGRGVLLWATRRVEAAGGDIVVLRGREGSSR